MIEVDHVLWAAADLDEGVATLAERTGLIAVPGGSHPGWGTRNALAGLGDTYLEVLATDPAQDGGWFADEVLSLPGPTLFRWALRTDEMDVVADRVRAAGFAASPAAMSRETPQGTTLRWRIAFVEGHDLGRIVPFVIDWLDTPHPAGSLEPQGRLGEVALGHPRPDRVRDLLAVLGIDAEVGEARDPWLRATIVTPGGAHHLGGPPGDGAATVDAARS